MIMKLGPELNYIGHSGTNLSESPYGLANFVFVNTDMLVSSANEWFERAMAMKGMQTFTVEVFF